MALHGNVLYIADRSCSMIRTMDLTGSVVPATTFSWGRLKTIYR
jgi:hypothetical protein